MGDEREASVFVRVLVAILCLLLIAMVGYRFLAITPVGQIDSGLLLLIRIVTILILSESFDNFSIGKLITVSREVKKKEDEVKKLEAQNSQLLAQILTIANSQQQTQSHISVSGDYHNAPVVQPATPEEITDSRDRDEPVAQTAGVGPLLPARVIIDHQKFEKLAFEKYAAAFGIDPVQLIKEAKLVYRLKDQDPISNYPTIFDAYVRSASEEAFIEFKVAGLSAITNRDRLYVRLSKAFHYSQANSSRVRLDRVVVNVPGRSAPGITDSRLADYFAPAVAAGILRIVYLELSPDEAMTIQRQSPEQ